MTDLKPTLEGFCRQVGCDSVAVFFNSPESLRANLVAFVGEEPRPHVPFGVTPLGECAAGGPIVHREVKNTKVIKYHSHLYLPLQDEDGTWGAMVFAAVQPEFFGDSAKVRLAQGCAQCLTRSSLAP